MLFITVVLFIPLYIYFIWGLCEPEEAYFFLQKWEYKEVPEPSDIGLKIFKIANIVGIIILTIIIIVTAINSFKPDPFEEIIEELNKMSSTEYVELF